MTQLLPPIAYSIVGACYAHGLVENVRRRQYLDSAWDCMIVASYALLLFHGVVEALR